MRLAKQTWGTCLIGTCDDPGELSFLLVLALDDSLDDGGMVRPEVDEDMADAVLPERLEESERGCVAADCQYGVSLYMRVHTRCTYTMMFAGPMLACSRCQARSCLQGTRGKQSDDGVRRSIVYPMAVIVE